MPNKKEIERRKQIKRDLNLKAKKDFENSLPINREIFKALFDHLDNELSNNNCDHNLKYSIEFLQSQSIDNIEEVTEWFKENGGYCDCEVLANVEEKFDGNAIL